MKAGWFDEGKTVWLFVNSGRYDVKGTVVAVGAAGVSIAVTHSWDIDRDEPWVAEKEPKQRFYPWHSIDFVEPAP